MTEISDEKARAIVIGSGFGGAVAACRLRQAGVPVLVLERGRRYEAADFPALPSEAALLPDLRRWVWQQDQGLWDIEDLGELVSVQAAGFGGGSLIYANVHLRAPASVFGKEWPRAYQGGAELGRYYDLAGYMVDASPITEQPGFKSLKKTHHLKLASEKLEQAFFYPPLTVNYRAKKRQAACTNCGSCCTGCPTTAKNTLDYNYLAIAESRGARVRTQCEVLDIEQLDDGRWAVDCLDHLTARREVLEAKWLFVCAGVVNSTRLLARARLERNRTSSQSRVGLGYYPNADALGVVYDTTDAHSPSVGPAITGAAVRWDTGVATTPFVMIQDGGYARELESLLGILRASVFLNRNVRSKAERASPPDDSPRPRAPSDDLPSPLDGVVDAARLGALRRIAPATLLKQLPDFLEEVKRPLMLSNVVDATISLSIAQQQADCFLTRGSSPENPLLRAWASLVKRGIYAFFMGKDAIATQALRAIIAGGHASFADRAREMFGHTRQAADQRAMLLAMGRDARPSVLLYDGASDRLVADLDLFNQSSVYSTQESFMTDLAVEFGGELRLNPLWSLLGKPITVHSQGGCRMSDDPRTGVTNAEGAVYGCPGLYVMDGSSLCSSVGVNPSATILAIAERNILAFIRSNVSGRWPDDCESDGATEYRTHREKAREWAERAAEKKWDLSVPAARKSPEFATKPIGIQFKEQMQGYFAPLAQDEPRAIDRVFPDAEYRRREAQGRPEYALEFELAISTPNLERFIEDVTHKLQIGGRVRVRLPGARGAEYFPIKSGVLGLFAEPTPGTALISRHKSYGLRTRKLRRAQELTTDAPGYEYRTRIGRPRRNEQRLMTYSVSFQDGQGQSFRIEGYKRVRDDPALDAWRDTSTLFCKLIHVPSDGTPQRLEGLGAVHVEMLGFLYGLIPSIQTTTEVDPGVGVAAVAKFAVFFFGTLQRIYAPELWDVIGAVFHPNPSQIHYQPRRRRH